MKRRSIFIGYDPREREAFEVARASILAKLSQPIWIHSLILDELRARGVYTRPTERNERGTLIDVLSRRPDYDGAMSTEFALSRFAVKGLAKTGLALFMDCDVLVRTDLVELFDHCEKMDPCRAVYCVKHNHIPTDGIKMDGQKQVGYPRKNWSSVYVIDCDHPANDALTHEMLNSQTGRYLHGFSWLSDEDIGALPLEWNWLEGESPEIRNPKIVHMTRGGPWFAEYQDVAYAHEWRAMQRRFFR